MKNDLSRMADFQMWSEACESAMGLAPGEFVEAYAANRETASRIILESSPIVEALLTYLKKNPEPKLEATATELLDKLSVGLNYKLKERPGWPKSPRVLSAILKRVAPNLRQIGIVAVQDTRGGGNDRENVWRITPPPTPPVQPKKKKPKKKTKKAGSKGRTGSKKHKTV